MLAIERRLHSGWRSARLRQAPTTEFPFRKRLRALDPGCALHVRQLWRLDL